MTTIGIEPEGEATAACPLGFVCFVVKGNDVVSSDAGCFYAVSADAKIHRIVTEIE